MYTHAELEALVEAMFQLLDDMGPNSSCSVCLAAKAQARVAFEPFAKPDDAEWIMPLDAAKLILKEVES
jgi:hypothetical protein